ncbi:hypothetical protein [Megasphaera cerevisiae]|jgi:hypothetical protein|uniref:hypothetical protein n=1 Tax=Megasphaera cerevisiae TaxID=39029 RepID=UPI000942B8A0|nr:hypothetical protein [Megasphaera cerevisiae]OKY52984.1 hypothetical protein BSR42_09880 [Megasphaera cerevisiae]
MSSVINGLITHAEDIRIWLILLFFPILIGKFIIEFIKEKKHCSITYIILKNIGLLILIGAGVVIFFIAGIEIIDSRFGLYISLLMMGIGGIICGVAFYILAREYQKKGVAPDTISKVSRKYKMCLGGGIYIVIFCIFLAINTF